MATIKEEARQLVEQLPDDVTWKDVLYEVYVRQKLEAGRIAVADGDVVAHEEVQKRFAGR